MVASLPWRGSVGFHDCDRRPELIRPDQDRGLLAAAWMLTKDKAVEVRVLARRDKGTRRSRVIAGCRATRCGGTCGTPRRNTRSDPSGRSSWRRMRITSGCDWLAQPDVIPATALLRELVEQGRTGGISQFKAFMASLRRARRNQDPAPVSRRPVAAAGIDQRQGRLREHFNRAVLGPPAMLPQPRVSGSTSQLIATPSRTALPKVSQ